METLKPSCSICPLKQNCAVRANLADLYRKPTPQQWLDFVGGLRDLYGNSNGPDFLNVRTSVDIWPKRPQISTECTVISDPNQYRYQSQDIIHPKLPVQSSSKNGVAVLPERASVEGCLFQDCPSKYKCLHGGVVASLLQGEKVIAPDTLNSLVASLQTSLSPQTQDAQKPPLSLRSLFSNSQIDGQSQIRASCQLHGDATLAYFPIP